MLLTADNMKVNIQGLDRSAIFNGRLYKRIKPFSTSTKNKLITYYNIQ